MNSQEQQAPPATGLGTFGGVYTPSILTILGVIMYLRFGWVVGNVGLLGTLAIVTLSTSITFLTSLSVSAIATDRVVRVGGAYYMISRSLGLESGGAVGIPLYFAQALSVALYTIGFAESVVQTFGHLNQTYVALITTIAVAIIAFTSASVAIRAQYIIMGAIALSLISFLFGKPIEPTAIELWVTARQPFWAVFAVFFPAVTGIMAGVNMSGDLRDPTKSIPLGTLAAVGTGYVIYMILPIIMAMRADASTLATIPQPGEPLVIQQMARWGPAILLGVWGATLSSALGSILGAPRVLQSLARDGILPRWLKFLGQGSGPSDEPRMGTVVTLGVAIAAVTVGDLNLIAPILTMFFLTTYLVLNVAAGIEGFLNSPSFRPTFPVHWLFSVLGDSEAPERRDRYCQMIGNLHRAKRSLIILHENCDRGFGGRDRIDIWWGGRQANGSLMLLLAYLLRTDIAWRNAQIFLKLVVPDQAAAQAAQINLDQMIHNLHLEAIAKVITADHRPFEEILHHSSQNADLIFLGMATPNPEFKYTQYYEGLQGKVQGLPTTLFVLAAPDFAFEEVLTEGL